MVKGVVDLSIYHRPEYPWIVPSIVPILDSYLNNTFTCYEFGSGSSTLWLSNRVNFIYSVEHDEVWFNKNLNTLQGINNVDLKLFKDKREYVASIDKFKDNTFDLVFIDGIERARCLKNSILKLKSKGILLIDNFERAWCKPVRSLIRNWDGIYSVKGEAITPDGLWTTALLIKP